MIFLGFTQVFSGNHLDIRAC